MRYQEVVLLTKDEAERIEKALNWKKGCPENERFDKDDCFVKTARFSNGFHADLKVAGTEFEEYNDEDEEAFPYHNAAWTEMVLFDPNGSEAAVSEVWDDYLGGWELEHGEDSYEVYICETEKEAQSLKQLFRVYGNLYNAMLEEVEQDGREQFVAEFAPGDEPWTDFFAARNKTNALMGEISERKNDAEDIFAAAGLTMELQEYFDVFGIQ